MKNKKRQKVVTGKNVKLYVKLDGKDECLPLGPVVQAIDKDHSQLNEVNSNGEIIRNDKQRNV